MVADSVIELICDDMVFKDMQNRPEYISMNTKLKKSTNNRRITEKQKEKELKAINKKKTHGKREKTRRKSKFATKYKDRIISIQESEKKREEKLKNITK